MDRYVNTPLQMCGYYSITTDRVFEYNASSLKYFKFPHVPLDLNKGIREIKEKPDSYYNEKMNSLLSYIVKDKSKLIINKDNLPLIPSTKFVTFRGIIRMIMCSPYETRSGWCILATKYKGNIYLCQLTSMEKRLAFKNKPFSSRRFAFYGPKFEQYCLSDDPSKMPNTSARLDECAQFFCVFKRKLVGRDFLFAGEMDGVISDTAVNLDNPKTYKDIKFIELKVSQLPHKSSRSEENFKKYKCQNVWTQSFLTGVNNIYFGFRDQKGIVQSIGSYELDELFQNWRNYWDPTECFKFLDYFLELVEGKLANIDCPDTVFEFNYDENTRAISHKLHKGKTQLSLLPDWYLNAVNS